MRISILGTALALAIALRAGAAEMTQAQLAEGFEKLRPAMGLVEFSIEALNERSGEVSKRDSNALGIVVSPTGLVMTHGHMVIENNKPFNIRVTLGAPEDEREYEAILLEKPDELNVVFLQLKSDAPLNLPYVRFAPREIEIGESVGIYGLLGETLDFAPSLAVARIGAVLEHPRTTFCLEGNVRFGFVGGPVMDAGGAVVGVVGFDLARGEGGELYTRSGHPLVFQSALFKKYIDTPPTVRRPEDENTGAWMGVFTQPLTDDFAKYWTLPLKGGLIVSTVVAGSPAAVSGIRPGDVIVQFGEKQLHAKQDRDVVGFTKLVRDAGAGTTVPVTVLRGGQSLTVNVTLEARPRSSGSAAEYENAYFGITVREITRDIRIALNLDENVKGVIVRRVTSGSIAQLAKLGPGVIILRIGGHAVGNVAEFQKAVEQIMAEKPSEVTIFGRIGSANTFFRLSPRWN